MKPVPFVEPAVKSVFIDAIFDEDFAIFDDSSLVWLKY
jgi:hypothetical protein